MNAEFLHAEVLVTIPVNDSPTSLGSPEIIKKPKKDSLITIANFFDKLPNNYSLLNIAESKENISELSNLFSKKGEIIEISLYPNIDQLLLSINLQRQVDAASMLGQLHKIKGGKEKIAVLSAIKGRLKPEGVFLITVPVNSGMGKLTVADRLKSKLKIISTPEQYKELIEKSGLIVIGEILRSTSPKTDPAPKNFIYEVLAEKPTAEPVTV